MGEDKTDKRDFSVQEEAAVEDFFKALNLAFRNASMYFREHPSFIKTIQALQMKLEGVTSFRKILDIGVTAEDILLDNKYLKRGKPPYKELAQYLHKRRIQHLTINTAVSPRELGDFVSKAALAIKDVQEGRSIVEILDGIEGIKIEGLDYSSLLATSGKHPKDIWRVLLGKEPPSGHSLDSKLLQYYSENIESIMEEVGHAPLEKGAQENFLDNLEKVSKSLEDFQPEKAQKFARSITRPLLKSSHELLNTFLKQDKFTKLKDFLSKNLDKDFLFENCLEQLTSFRQFNPLFLNFYNVAIEKIKDEEKLADELSRFLGSQDSVEDKEKIIEPLKELFFRDRSDKFVSSLYKKTLSYLSEYPLVSPEEEGVFEEYKKDLEEEFINIDYFYTLLELLRQEDKLTDLELIISVVKKELPVFFEEKKLDVIKDLIGLLREKLSSCDNQEMKKLLQDFYEKIYNFGFLDYILKNIKEIENVESVKSILANIKDAPRHLVDEFFKSRDLEAHKKLKEILVSLDDEQVVASLKDFLKTRASPFILKELIDVLSQIKTENSLRFLEEIYENNKNDDIIVLDVLKAVGSNPFKKKDFIKAFVFHKDYSFRRETMGSFLAMAGKKEKDDLIEQLLNVNNFLGLKDRFILENIDILSKFHLEEAAPVLVRFVKTRPFLFRKRRDKLRIRSLEALIDMDAGEIKRLLPSLLKDPSPRIRELAMRLEKDGKV